MGDFYSLLYEAFDKRPAIVSQVKRVLSVFLERHLRYILEKRYQRVFIEDLWGVAGDLLRGFSLEGLPMDRVVFGRGDPQILVVSSPGVDRELLKRSIAVYSGTGAAVFRSLGFDPVVRVLSSMRQGVYIVRGLGPEIVLIEIRDGGLRELRLPQKYSEAVRTLSEAFQVYGAFRQSDAIKILVRELGLDKVEAQRILRSLYETGVIRFEKGGYIVIEKTVSTED